MPHYLTVKEVAEMIRKSEDTVYRRLEQERYPHAVKEGHTWLIPLDDVLASLKFEEES